MATHPGCQTHRSLGTRTDSADRVVTKGEIVLIFDRRIRDFSGQFGTVASGAQGSFDSYEIDNNDLDVLAALSAVPERRAAR